MMKNSLLTPAMIDSSNHTPGPPAQLPQLPTTTRTRTRPAAAAAAARCRRWSRTGARQRRPQRPPVSGGGGGWWWWWWGGISHNGDIREWGPMVRVGTENKDFSISQMMLDKHSIKTQISAKRSSIKMRKLICGNMSGYFLADCFS